VDALQPSTRINLERATVLVLDDNGPSLDILSQVVSGFGVKQLHRAESGHGRPGPGPHQDLRPDHQRRSDARVDGIEFIEWLRREGPRTIATSP
jgi:CheY-like chemotaxis protein